MPPATHRSASSHARRWETFSPPPPPPPPSSPSVSLFFSCSPFALPPAFLSQLYKLPLFSLLFPRLQVPALGMEVWGRGYAKRCGIYLSFLAPVAGFHKALWPFPFTPSSLILLPLKPPSFFSFLSIRKKKKRRATRVFQANLSPFWPPCYFCSFYFNPRGTQHLLGKDETKAHVQVSSHGHRQ